MRPAEPSDEWSRQRLEGWKRLYPQLHANFLCAYLHACGCGEDAVLQFLAEPIEALRHRLGAPQPWLETLRSAFDHAAQSEPISFEQLSGGQGAARLLNLIELLIRQANQRLCAGLASLRHDIASPLVVDECVERVLLINAARRLLEMVIPTLVPELNVARVQGSLPGETQERRFDDFVARLRQPEMALGLLREYPVLARQVVVCLDDWATGCLEFLRRLDADWQDLRDCFRAGGELGALVSVDDTRGDQHQAGRSVLILTFSTGFHLVYKPRPLAAAAHFQDFMIWLNGAGAQPRLRTIEILDRGGHGWVEFVEQRSCASVEEVRRFYLRQGEYLAVLYALEGTDFHYENLIAVGEHPVLVDLETLFQPYVRGAGQTIDEAFRDSVLRIGLLPQRMFGAMQGEGIDLSGLGAAVGQALPYAVARLEGYGTDEMRLVQTDGESSGAGNQPSLNGAKVDALDYVDEIAAGFGAMYQLLLAHRDELLSDAGPLARFADDSIRAVLRPTLAYGLLLRSSLHPDALRDALERDMLFGSLWGRTQGQGHLERIFCREIADLNHGDVPLFTTRPDSHDLFTGSGQLLSDFFPETGMSIVHRRLRQLGADDRQRQVWFIRSSLATMAMGREPARPQTRPRCAGKIAPTPRRLMAAAAAIGERLEALALHDGVDVRWIGLTLAAKDNWSLVPLGLDLYNGLPGVALFLAYLGEVSQVPNFTALARETLSTIRRQLTEISLSGLSIGAFEGLGGLVYLFSHLGILWEDRELLREATGIAERSRALIFYDRKFDIIGGAAGSILSCLALCRAAPSDGALAAAIEYGDHLLRHAQPVADALSWPPHFPARAPLTGLAHGASGMAWALLELSAMSGEARFKDAALKAFAYENSLFSEERKNWPDLRETNGSAHRRFMTGWCHGASGIVLARLRSLKLIADPIVRLGVADGLETTLKEGFRGDQCLCHGGLGNIEPLMQAAETLDPDPWSGYVERASAAILDGIDNDGWLCGVPLGVETPGLMTGLAGIGYGLLRLAAPSDVPAVLVLAPPISK